MRKAGKRIHVLAMVLALAMVITACQVPEGVEIPSGVSVPSDISDLTSEELEQLESYLEEVEASADMDDSEEQVSGDVQSSDAAGTESGGADAIGAEGTSASEETAAATDTGKDAVMSTVNLPSGRDWVHKILNVEEYRKAYPDLENAYGDNWDGYVDHYLTHGLYEGRDEGKLFDPWEYAESYPDVKEAFGDDVNAIIAHYVNHGINEGKTAGTAAGYVDMADKVSREYMMSHDVVERGPSSRMDALLGHMDTVLKYARNIEGAYYPRLFTDGLNVDNYEPTKWNRGYENETTTSNFYAQMNLLKAMDGMTLLTGDPKYSEAALEQISLRFNTPGLVDESGLIYGGGHGFIDLMTGQYCGLEYHETKDYQPPYELMYKADPEGALRYFTAYWNSHIQNWATLAMSRHGHWNVPDAGSWDLEYTDLDPFVECDGYPFLCTGNDMMEISYYMTEITGDPKYAVWGERMLDKYIGIGHPDTGLVGAQYGIDLNNEFGGDRLLYSVLGADFVTRTGFDFKTATMDDYRLFGSNALIDRTSTKQNTAYGPVTFAEIYHKTGDEKIYNYIKNNMLGWARYIYDPELHRYKTPILSDGTDLNEGKDKPQLIANRTGYHMTEGKPFPEYESVWGGVFPGAIDAISILKPEDEVAYQEIWEATRAYGRNVGLGDIGTRMGENVKMTPETAQIAPQYIQAVVKMYKYTGNQDYLDAACIMADRLVAGCYDPEIGLFRTVKNAPYVAINTEHLYAVFMVEAAVRGYVDEINLDLSHGGHDVPHSGMGQVSMGAVHTEKSKTAVKSVKFDREAYTIVVSESAEASYSDLSTAKEAQAIRQMGALGVMGAEEDGLFHPEKHVTRAEMVGMVNRFFGFNDDAITETVFADVDLDAAYGHYEVTRAEMASIVAKALAIKLPDKTWNTGDATYRLTDADEIPAWAKDYADIVTNYRLMVGLEEETFEASAVVTKDMLAGIFQEVARYIELPQLKSVLPEVLPLRPDNDLRIWETMDGSVVEVDSKGRLYPVGIGSTTVRVTVDGMYADLEVTVAEVNDWMIQEISVNGEVLTSFVSDILDHQVNLDLGIVDVPAITATSFSGEEVVVEYPVSLPGVATLYVRGCDVKYTLEINNDFVDYIVNENFNHKIGTPLESVVTSRFNWFVNGETIRYRDRWVVVPKNWVRPDYEGYGCMVFPYDHKKNITGASFLMLDDADVQGVGAEADDKVMIMEMDIAAKNMAGMTKGFEINFIQKLSDTSCAVARFKIDEKGLFRESTRGNYDRTSKRKLPDSEFVNLKIAIDKKNKTYNYYYNGDLLQKDLNFFHGNDVPNIGAIYFITPVQDAECQAELFIDNIKVYNLTHAAFEAMMPQETLPPATPRPEWLINPLDLDFDDIKVGTAIEKIAEDHYVGHNAVDLYGGFGTVVSKADIASGAEADDHCMEFKYNSNATTNGAFRFILDNSIAQWFGEDQEDKNIVVEMDLAIAGNDELPGGYRICLNEILSNSYRSTARFMMYDNEFARIKETSGKIVDASLRTALNKGEFNTFKIVTNKKTGRFSYYINGVCVEQGVAPLYGDTPNFSNVVFEPMKDERGRQIDSKLYLDNLKIYMEDVQPEPTARPTNAPVYNPVAMDTTFDEFLPGKMVHTLKTDYWTASLGLSYHHNRGTVVSKKDTADPNALAEDNCLQFIPSTSLDEKFYDMPFYFGFEPERQYALGSPVEIDKYLVVEMDMAIQGNDPKDGGMSLRFGGNGDYALANFRLFDNYLARFRDSRNMTSPNEKNAYNKGDFAHLVWVLDRETKKYAYYWNGQLVEENVAAQFSGQTETPALKYVSVIINRETLAQGVTQCDVRCYVDNMKVYVTDQIPNVPAPTPAPGATSVPTAMPTTVPTAAPTATAVPVGPTATPAPTAAPTAEPTPAPTMSPFIVNTGFDEFDTGKMVHTLTGEWWNGNLGLSYHHNRGIVVSKKAMVDQNATESDKCLEFTPSTSADEKFYDLPFNFIINGQRHYALGTAVTEDKYIVIEFDIAVNGADAKPAGYNIRIGGNGDYALTNFRLTDTYLARYLDSRNLNSMNERNAYTKGGFAHFKWVLDRETKRYTYYWNGQLVEENLAAQFNDADQTPALKYIRFNINKETLADGVTSLDSQLYVDNLKIYVTDSAE